MPRLPKIAAAVGTFAALHSLLAYRGTKHQVKRLVGEKHFAAYYRLFYNAQAIASTAALFAYVLKQPDQGIYELKGWPKRLAQIGQVGAAAFCGWALLDFGLARFFGVSDFKSATDDDAGTSLVPRESQGPTADENGQLITTGAFQYSRHPLNLSAFIFFWLMPKMSRNGLVCGVLGSVYLLTGSWHEEVRLRRQYGEQYEKYQSSGVPFFFPRLNRGRSKATD